MFSPARPRSFVCLCVCLRARLLKNACMDLDEMLCVGRCRDQSWTRIGFIHVLDRIGSICGRNCMDWTGLG